MSKQCKSAELDGCGQTLPLTDFYSWGKKTDSRCKECRKALERKRHKAKPKKEKVRLNNFQKLPLEKQIEVIKMINEGRTIYAISKYLKKSPTTLYRWKSLDLIQLQKVETH